MNDDYFTKKKKRDPLSWETVKKRSSEIGFLGA
jgi:hypothetical protein